MNLEINRRPFQQFAEDLARLVKKSQDMLDIFDNGDFIAKLKFGPKERLLWREIIKLANINNAPVVLDVGPGAFPNPVNGALTLGVDFQVPPDLTLSRFPCNAPYGLFKAVLEDVDVSAVQYAQIIAPYPIYSLLTGKVSDPDEDIDVRHIITDLYNRLPRGSKIITMLDPKKGDDVSLLQEHLKKNKIVFGYFKERREFNLANSDPISDQIVYGAKSQYFEPNQCVPIFVIDVSKE